MWGYCWHGVMMGGPRTPGLGLGWAWGTMQPGVTLLHPHLQSQLGTTSLCSKVHVMLLEVSLLPRNSALVPQGAEVSCALANLVVASSHHS